MVTGYAYAMRFMASKCPEIMKLSMRRAKSLRYHGDRIGVGTLTARRANLFPTSSSSSGVRTLSSSEGSTSSHASTVSNDVSDTSIQKDPSVLVTTMQTRRVSSPGKRVSARPTLDDVTRISKGLRAKKRGTGSRMVGLLAVLQVHVFDMKGTDLFENIYLIVSH